MKIATSFHRNSKAQAATIVDPASLSRDLGGKWHRSYGVAPCPVCQPQKRKDQNALTINSKDERLLLHCKKSGCDFKDILIASGINPGTVEIDQMVLANAERERAEQTAKLRARAQSLWDYADPINNTNGEAYLRGRGITCPLPETLRWLPDTYHVPSGSYCSAMVANIMPTGGVHRTFFTKKGTRLEKSAKMMLGPCSGGAVRLSDGMGPLVICEGIETGLSLLSGLLDSSHTIWAALSTSGIKGLILPSRPGELIVAADGDEAGALAATALARTATGKGWKVSLMTAPDGQDWNDVLQKGATV
jgi:hypothetical protein